MPASAVPTLSEQRHRCEESFGLGAAAERIAACTAVLQSREANEPIRLEALVSRASGYMGVGDVPRAIADYNEAIRRDNGDTSLYWMRGMAYARLKDFRRAIADYGLAIKYGPTDSAPLIERGKSYLQLGSVSLALADFDRAATLGSSGWACEERETVGIGLDRAHAECDAAIQEAKANPFRKDYSEPYVWRAILRMKQKRFQDAWNDCDAAVQIKPDSYGFFGRGLAALALGRTVEGRADIAKALQLDPKISEYYAAHGLAPE